MTRSIHAKQYRKLYGTKRWRALRQKILTSDPYCRMPTCHKIASVVDHIIPHRGDLTLFYDEDNLQPLCKTCHDSHKQRDERRGYSGDVDKSGWPSDAAHPVNVRNDGQTRTPTETG